MLFVDVQLSVTLDFVYTPVSCQCNAYWCAYDCPLIRLFWLAVFSTSDAGNN